MSLIDFDSCPIQGQCEYLLTDSAPWQPLQTDLLDAWQWPEDYCLGCSQCLFSLLGLESCLFIPKGQRCGGSVLKIFSDGCISAILTEVAYKGWLSSIRGVRTSTSKFFPGLTMLGSSFCLIEASQTLTLPLTEVPSSHYWQLHLVNNPALSRGSKLLWGEADIKFIPVCDVSS